MVQNPHQQVDAYRLACARCCSGPRPACHPDLPVVCALPQQLVHKVVLSQHDQPCAACTRRATQATSAQHPDDVYQQVVYHQGRQGGVVHLKRVVSGVAWSYMNGHSLYTSTLAHTLGVLGHTAPQTHTQTHIQTCRTHCARSIHMMQAGSKLAYQQSQELLTNPTKAFGKGPRHSTGIATQAIIVSTGGRVGAE